MRLAIYSDLHLEHEPWIPPSLDVELVILAGDIHERTQGLEWASTAFRHASKTPAVLYVAGNHEYYGANQNILTQFRKPDWEREGVIFLENRTVTIRGVRFLGCTLWSDFALYGHERAPYFMASASRHIPDYHVIHAAGNQRLTPKDTWRLNRAAAIWLDKALAAPFDGKTVVVTHFAPHPGCVDPRFKGGDFAPYAVSDMTRFLKKHRIDVWCHGHTHFNVDFVTEGGCRIVSNQRGCPGAEAGGFRPALVIDL